MKHPLKKVLHNFLLMSLAFFLHPLTANAQAGTWSATGPMITARYVHTATLLPNGKVLVAGGLQQPPVASAELYDPTTGTFNATGSMITARFDHTATLLPNGQVLIAGGDDFFGNSFHPLASAELYDPTTGTFSATGSMTTARFDHTATLLPNGQVLIAGGADSGNSSDPVASAELYDPTTGTFSATGSMTVARLAPTATLLPYGQVLLVGGINHNALVQASAELYDPTTATFSATGSMITARYTHTATLLPNGQVLLAGGQNYNIGPLASAELYDPTTATFSATGSMITARFLHTATLLPNGQVLAAGGNFDPLSSTELYLSVNVPTDKDECKKNGWMTLTRPDGNSFKNQGDCIQFVNTGK